MTFRHTVSPTPAAFGLALALFVQTTTLQAQSLSSGSGEGTGTGTGAGAGINSTGGGTGNMTGPGSLRYGSGMGRGLGYSPGFGQLDTNELRNRLRGMPPMRPSPGVRSEAGLPTDTGLVPLDAMPDAIYPTKNETPPITAAQLDELDQRSLEAARSLPDPGERALALDRVARMKLFGRKFDDAWVALDEAGQAALSLPPGLVHDLRLMAITTTLTTLAQEQTREGMVDESVRLRPEDPGTANPPVPARSVKERLSWLDRATFTFRRATELATAITNENFRSEQLYRVVLALSEQSKDVALEANRGTTTRIDLKDQGGPLLDYADRTMSAAVAAAKLAPRYAWRDQALEDIVMRATESDQYAKALEVAREIPQAETRTDSLIRVAEGLARRNMDSDATKVFMEAAEAVASIPLEDPRGVLAGVLADSLISVGRFDDARATIPLISDPLRRLYAYGAVAESQGRRGLASSAFRWIDRDAAPADRSVLKRRVADGVLAAIDQIRTQTQTQTNPRPAQ